MWVQLWILLASLFLNHHVFPQWRDKYDIHFNPFSPLFIYIKQDQLRHSFVYLHILLVEQTGVKNICCSKCGGCSLNTEHVTPATPSSCKLTFGSCWNTWTDTCLLWCLLCSWIRFIPSHLSKKCIPFHFHSCLQVSIGTALQPWTEAEVTKEFPRYVSLCQEGSVLGSAGVSEWII